MPRTGSAELPLHGGSAPKWLFKRMVGLAEGIVDVMLLEHSQDVLLQRLSDPFWFQAFSCVLGFDWHSSGTTTVTCGALKDALSSGKHGILVAGGKGRVSRNAPAEIVVGCDELGVSSQKSDELVYSSRMSAKVDNSAVLDSYQLYHHVLVFSENGKLCVIQQGINNENGYARRYHWLSENIDNFVMEPHAGIVGSTQIGKTLDMTSRISEEAQKISVDLICDSPDKLKGVLKSLRKPGQSSLSDWGIGSACLVSHLDMPKRINWNFVRGAYEFQPRDYEELLSVKGVGPRTVRALALVSELVYGTTPSWKDPVKFSFAVGGKDGVPYPVDRKTMDESIEILKTGVEEAKLGRKEKVSALRRLSKFVPPDIEDWDS
jgi:hypothetical protein